jgi:AraC-like DNA-binding protein
MILYNLFLNNKIRNLIFLILICESIAAQKSMQVFRAKNYSYFEESTNQSDSVKSKQIARLWIAKSKSEKNWIQLTKAYRAIIFLEYEKMRLNYADSLISAAKKTKDAETIGQAYLTKGIVYYSQKKHNQALDNYLLADGYISQTKNKKAFYKVKYSIAHTKYYLGFYDEAISLFQECLIYFEEESDIAYLNTLHSLGLCFNKIGKYNKSSYYNKIGLQSCKELENTTMIAYFNHSEAINDYGNGNFSKAIAELKKSIPQMQTRKDFANETLANFYIGMSYWKLNQKEQAIPYFKKIDKSFQKYNYTKPDLRHAYELLIDYYKESNNQQLQLHYIDRLLKVDSILSNNYKYLSKRIFKEYDTKKLLLDKNQIKQQMITGYRVHYTVISALTGVVIFLVWRHKRNKKRYKLKFEELMSKKEIPLKHLTENNNDNGFEINPELVKTILQNLEKFEKNKKYLEKDMTLIKLSGYLKTNPKYASKVILKYRGKKTIEYISDLKIDYIVDKLKTENKFRNYTNKALADEAGFGSTQNFTKAFNKRLEMPPTFFIQQLKDSFPL